jgi:hypothetical protein
MAKPISHLSEMGIDRPRSVHVAQDQDTIPSRVKFSGQGVEWAVRDPFGLRNDQLFQSFSEWTAFRSRQLQPLLRLYEYPAAFVSHKRDIVNGSLCLTTDCDNCVP